MKLSTAQRDLLVRIGEAPHQEAYVEHGRQAITVQCLVRSGHVRRLYHGWAGLTALGRGALLDITDDAASRAEGADRV